MRLTESQAIYMMSNKNSKNVLTGYSAFEYNGLIYGCNSFYVYTSSEKMDRVQYSGIVFEHYHFNDEVYLREIHPNLYVPSRERAIVDAIAHMDKYYREGELIEALQDYTDQTDDYTLLYEVANHYGVSIDKIDEWIREAITSPPASIG